MSTLEEFNTMLQSGEITTEEALKLFDELDPVDLEFMIGRWQGAEVHTHHPLNHLLEATGWYGKEFIDADQVHPLLFLDSNNQIFKVSPSPLMMSLAMNLGLHLPILKHQAMKSILRSMTSIFMASILKTEASQARVRMMEYRQKVSATMIYDRLPIHDIFRKADDNTVLGLMDYKGVPQPFFFVLKRDKAG